MTGEGAHYAKVDGVTGFWDAVWELLQNFGGPVGELIDKVQRKTGREALGLGVAGPTSSRDLSGPGPDLS